MSEKTAVAFELSEDVDHFAGADVALVGGESFDIGEALEEGDGLIVLDAYPRVEGHDPEVQRAFRDGHIIETLRGVEVLREVKSADVPDEVPSYDTVELPTDTEEPDEPTITELRKRAKELEIDGRSNMTREELIAAIVGKESEVVAEGGEPGDELREVNNEGGEA